MYHLQLFNVDSRGARVDVVQVGNTFASKSLALTEARDLRLGTHFRITDDRGQVVMEDSISRRYEAAMAKRRAPAPPREPSLG